MLCREESAILCSQQSNAIPPTLIISNGLSYIRFRTVLTRVGKSEAFRIGDCLTSGVHRTIELDMTRQSRLLTSRVNIRCAPVLPAAGRKCIKDLYSFCSAANTSQVSHSSAEVQVVVALPLRLGLQ